MKRLRLRLALALAPLFWMVLGSPARAGDAPPGPAAHAPAEFVSPGVTLDRLQEGNRRFADGQPRHPHEAKAWRETIEKAQNPFALILGCSDSRVSPELVFDQGLGDLFVVRVAGNVVDEDGIGSIEYAVDHLNVGLVVVLGHSNCGAVTAALDRLSDPAEEPAEVVSLLYRIEPALAGIPRDLGRDAQLVEAVKRNVEIAVRRLSRVPDMRKSLANGRLRIVGAVYDMHTCKVQFMPSTSTSTSPASSARPSRVDH